MTAIPFIGRASEKELFLGACATACEKGDEPGSRQYISFTGPEGIGKTALAAELVRLLSDSERRIPGLMIRFDDLDELTFLDEIARMRRSLGKLVPQLDCPRFEIAYSIYIAQFCPREFGPARFRVGPVDAEEMFKKSTENASKDLLKEAAKHLPGLAPLMAAGATITPAALAAMIGAAMSTAFTGAAIGLGGYLAVLLATHYVRGARIKIKKDKVLKSSKRLQALIRDQDILRPQRFREDLPLLLAEDLNGGLDAMSLGDVASIALFFDPVDPLCDPLDARAEPYARGFARLVSSLKRVYVANFSRTACTAWEDEIAVMRKANALKSVAMPRYQPLDGLSEEEIVVSLRDLPDLHCDEAALKLEVSMLPKIAGRETVSPASVATYWTTRVGQ